MKTNPLPWRHKPFPELVRLAWPIAVSMLSYSTMTLVDTLFVGRFGAEALAGVSVGGVLYFTLLCFGFGLLRAVKVSVSHSVGAGRQERVAPLLGAGLILAGALGLLTMAGGWLLSGSIYRVSSSLRAAGFAEAYVNARVWGAPFALAAIAMREARYGAGDPTTPMRSMIAANIANALLAYLLVIVAGLGVEGAGWAAAAATLVEVAWLVVVQRREGASFGLDRRGLREIRGIWRLGAPLGVQMLLEVGVFAMLTAIFASMSEIDVAAHQICIQVIHFSFLPAFALGEAASVLAGQAVGADEDALVPRVGRLTLAAAVVYTGACAVVMAVFGESIARAFTDNEALVALSVKLFHVAVAFQVFDGANIVARCVLRGAGDVRYAAVICVGTSWVLTPPLTLLLGYGLDYGVVGGWLGICAEIIAGAGILWWRLEKGGWRLSARRERERLAADRAEPEPKADGALQPA